MVMHTPYRTRRLARSWFGHIPVFMCDNIWGRPSIKLISVFSVRYGRCARAMQVIAVQWRLTPLFHVLNIRSAPITQRASSTLIRGRTFHSSHMALNGEKDANIGGVLQLNQDVLAAIKILLGNDPAADIRSVIPDTYCSHFRQMQPMSDLDRPTATPFRYSCIPN